MNTLLMLMNVFEIVQSKVLRRQKKEGVSISKRGFGQCTHVFEDGMREQILLQICSSTFCLDMSLHIHNVLFAHVLDLV